MNISFCPLARAAALGFVVATCGCASFAGRNDRDALAEAAAAPAEDVPEVVVELRTADGRVSHLKAPLSQPLFVQDAVRESGAMRKFRDMEITVERQVGKTQPARMPSRYDRSNRRVDPGFDYELHGGDVVVITEVDNSMIDRMLAPVLEPFGAMMGKGRGR